MATSPKKSFLMRVDPDLWVELERLAAAELRSINGEIEYLLREAISKRRGKAPAPANTQPKVIKIKKRADHTG